jgi:DNA-binding NtrC family response regulator
MARAIHQLSMRRNGPFMVLDCAALTPTMVEAELFGHERGSFTGAERRRAGAFERAHGGTLFLDEIGELPIVHQASLLGVLQRRRLRRIGSDAEVDVDVRVVCATNRRLEEEIQAGRFRADLFYRLGTVPLHLPPLRERAEDLEDLIAQFWLDFSGCKPEPLSPSQLMALSSYPFPGNVRELRGLVERALIDGHWPALPGREVKPPAEPSTTGSELPGQSFRDAKEEALQAFERRFFASLIKLTDGNASEAARKASIDRPHLLRMLRKYGLRD